MRLIRDILRWFFRNPFTRIVSILPTEAVYSIGKFGGTAYYYLHRARCRRIDRELSKTDIGLSAAERQHVVKRTCINMVLCEIEVLLYPLMNSSNIEQYTELAGREHLDKALQEGKGVLLVHAHFGNAQMLMPALGYRGYEVNQVGILPTDLAENLEDIFERKADDAAMRELEDRLAFEKSLPARFIYLKTSMKPIFEALKKGGIVAIAIDGLGGTRRVPIDFLGRKAEFSTGPISVASRTGAVVLPLFTIRGRARTKVIIEPPMHILADPSPAAVEADSARFVKMLEEFVRKYPCHYIKLFGYNKPFFTNGG